MFGGIPFEHFAHGGGGGFPGGSMGGSSEPPDTTKLYETLEVEKDATPKEIKKAYFRLSKTHHPDKGGDEHKFKEINAAYEILSDPEKRKAYDKYGLEGVDDEGGAQQRGEDLFSMFFGGGRGRGRSAGPRKGPSVQHPIKVSLEDLYNGKTVKLAINRKVIAGEVKVCDKCNGQGVVMEVRQLGPGMITQMQRHCPLCDGQGSMAPMKSERKVLEVHVEKGMKHNQKITFRGMADETPGVEPGDIHFIIQEKDHELFKRKGADLLVTKDVSLNQALTGFTVRAINTSRFNRIYRRRWFCGDKFLTLLFSSLCSVENQAFGWPRHCHQDSPRASHRVGNNRRRNGTNSSVHHVGQRRGYAFAGKSFCQGQPVRGLPRQVPHIPLRGRRRAAEKDFAQPRHGRRVRPPGSGRTLFGCGRLAALW